MIGKTLGHYQIVGKLGEGGMGVVYQARDLHLDRFVALKLLPADELSDPERKRRFVQEAKAASALNHPNIVHIYDITESEGVPFLAMEYVPGSTLGSVIGCKSMPLNEALKYSIQIADAIAKAHAAGIVHRDLKPSNVMVTEGGLVKILDFGLAKLAEQPGTGVLAETRSLHPQTEEGVILGTAEYMSPEQAEGKPVDARSDIFSFGAILYEMFSGRRAFHGESGIATLAQVLHDEPPPLHEIISGFPPEVERLVSRCMRKDRERRFQTMADLKVALEELREESQSGRVVTTVPVTGRSRRPWLWIAALASLAVIGALFWLFRTSSTPHESTLKEIPLTSYPGSEGSPSFSPDGNQIAFSWNGEKQDNSDIYVKLVGPGAPLRLTTNPANDDWPSWSPDGRTIAFLRNLGSGKFSIFVIPALGGTERKLVDVDLPTIDWLRGSYLAWLPDSKGIVFSHTDASQHAAGLFLIHIDTSETRRLTTAPGGSFGDAAPAVSPDGSLMVFTRIMGVGPGDIFLQRLGSDFLPAGPPKQITFDSKEVRGSAWTSDGRSILFSSNRDGDFQLWRIAFPSLGGMPGKPQRIESVGNGAVYPAVSRRGGRLAYIAASGGDLDIWRVAIPDWSKSDGRTATRTAPAKFITSTRVEFAPQYSPDGKKIAFESERGGSLEIWVCESDGSNCVQMTSFGGPLTGLPHWSPDGDRIVFYSRVAGKGQIFSVNAEGGAPRRLTNDSWDNFFPSWSRDGHWIYFGSNRSGTGQIWKMPVSGGSAVQVTKAGGSAAAESADGQYVFYTTSLGSRVELWKRPVNGGTETRVLESIILANFAVTDHGVYFMTQPDPQSNQKLIEFLSYADQKRRIIASIEQEVYQGLAISPDERWLLYAQNEPGGSNVMLVENFE